MIANWSAAAITVLLLAIAPAAVAQAEPAHSHSDGDSHDDSLAFGEPGDPRKPSRTIAIIIDEVDGKMLFLPSKIAVKKGEQIRFRLTNRGLLAHEISLSTAEANLRRARQMENNGGRPRIDRRARRLQPGKSGQLLWKFSKTGTFDFSCLVPGHRRAGMFGTVIVK